MDIYNFCPSLGEATGSNQAQFLKLKICHETSLNILLEPEGSKRPKDFFFKYSIMDCQDPVKLLHE